jgi:hypothetical protein
MNKRFLFVLLLVFRHVPFLAAQNTNEQTWFEYYGNLPFANSFNLENAVMYSTVIQTPQIPKWRSFEYTPKLEYGLSKRFDINIGTVFCYTQQTSTYNTFEIRPFIGTRIHFTPSRRVLLRMPLRWESRHFKNLETGEWEQSNRARVGAESLIPINRKSYFENKLWYAIFDVEWFLQIDPDVHEYYANRLRIRAGIGYRLNYSFRFELIYMNQQSRNGINESLYSDNNVFRFRLKQYFGRIKKPAQSSGSGN